MKLRTDIIWRQICSKFELTRAIEATQEINTCLEHGVDLLKYSEKGTYDSYTFKPKFNSEETITDKYLLDTDKYVHISLTATLLIISLIT